MITLISTLDSQIFDAYQRLKQARAEDDCAAIVEWMSRVDLLLDRRERPGSGAASPWLIKAASAEAREPLGGVRAESSAGIGRVTGEPAELPQSRFRPTR